MPTPSKKAATLPAGQLLINGYTKLMNPQSTLDNTGNKRLANMNTSPIQRRRRFINDDDNDDDQPLVPQHSKSNDADAKDQQPVDGKSKITAWPVPDTENESDANFAVLLLPEQRQPLDLQGDEQERTPHKATATKTNARQTQRPKRSRRSPSPPPVSHVDPHPRILISKVTEF